MLRWSDWPGFWNIYINNIFIKYIFVDVHKKSFDIKFENPTSIGIILRTRFDEVLYSLYTKVRAFF